MPKKIENPYVLAAKAELERRKRDGKLEPPEPLWKPNPPRDGQEKSFQQLCMECEADELFAGGAPGAGKSALLVGLAVTQHTNSIIFRRELSQMKGADGIISYSQQVIGQKGRFNATDNVWRKIDNGDGKKRNLEFAGVKNEDDKRKYLGRAHDLKCVAGDTPVRMANGDYKKISEVEVGDFVDTLEGPKCVSRVFDMGEKESVLVSYEIDGVTHTQIQGCSHALLTSAGWVSHDMYASSHPDVFSFSTLFHDIHKSSLAYRLKYEPFLHTRSTKHVDFSPLQEKRQVPRGGYRSHVSLWDLSSDMALLNLENYFSRFGSELRGVWRAALCPPVPLEVFPPLATPFRSELSARHLPSWREESGAPTYSLLEDCLDDCFRGFHQCDVHVHPSQVFGLFYPRLQGDVEDTNPISFVDDVQEETPRRTHCIQQYVHPYTMDKRQTLGDNEIYYAALKFTPVGKMHLYDITVDDANHYITLGNFVNKNCFDEAVEFTESQYLFLIGWNRSSNPDQRCRVIIASNPPTTPEGQWVTRRWAAWLDKKHPRPAKPGELRWYAMVDGKDTEMPDNRRFVVVNKEIIYDYDPNQFEATEIIEPKSRTFIPGRVMDNPYLMASGYIATIQRLPEPLRTIMLDPDKGFNMVIKDDLWQVIPTVWVMNAIERGKLTPKPINQPLSAIGVDPSRGGDDEFIIAKRYGAWYAPLVSYPGSEVPDGQTGANLVIREIDSDSDPIINIDVIGVGSSPRDFLIEYNAASEINDVNFAEGSQSFDETGKFKMANVRAECYWGMREALNPEKGDNLCLPDDDILKADLCASRYKITTRGIVIESKDEIRERIGRSPDRGDAVVLARYLDVTDAESLYYGAF